LTDVIVILYFNIKLLIKNFIIKKKNYFYCLLFSKFGVIVIYFFYYFTLTLYFIDKFYISLISLLIVLRYSKQEKNLK